MSDKKPGGSEAAIGWGILLCVFAALAYLIWWKFDVAIRSGIRWLRYGEMWVASWFVDDDYMVKYQGEPINFHALMKMAGEVPADRIDSELLGALSTVALYPFLPFFIVITLLIGMWALFRGPGSEHRQKFDLNSFIKKQANIFPIISPFVDFNPTKLPPRAPGSPVPAELPLFAEALSPEEWIVYNEIPVIESKIDEDVATKAFAKQLGARWKGAKHLAPHKQVLLAAFCLKAARKRADSDTMLGRLALCWSHKDGLKLSRDRKLLREARAVLANQSLSGIVLKACNEHAWENTALMRGLLTARTEGGVLAPAQFVWLRGFDRAIWYSLNNLGRQTLHMEAVGAMAHFKAEKLAQRPIPRPKVVDAITSLVELMASERVRALPQLDYSNSKKRGVKKLKSA